MNAIINFEFKTCKKNTKCLQIYIGNVKIYWNYYAKKVHRRALEICLLFKKKYVKTNIVITYIYFDKNYYLVTY